MQLSSWHSKDESNSQHQNELNTDVQTLMCINVNCEADSEKCFIESIHPSADGKLLNSSIECEKDNMPTENHLNNSHVEPRSMDLDLAVMKSVLLLLLEMRIHPNNVSDDNLRDYIKKVIESKAYLPYIKWAIKENNQC